MVASSTQDQLYKIANLKMSKVYIITKVYNISNVNAIPKDCSKSNVSTVKYGKLSAMNFIKFVIYDEKYKKTLK